MMPNETFQPFPKIARLSREVLITEKIDGTNGLIYITDAGEIFAGCRTRWIAPGRDDNYGFAAWVQQNREELLKLGPGKHFGEWWGKGIQRHYGMNEKVFSLFNAERWIEHDQEPQQIPKGDPRIIKMQEKAPACCRVVPVLYRGMFKTEMVDAVLETLKHNGSLANVGFMNPEGVIVYHIAAKTGFKKTIEKDEEWKGKQ